MRKFTCLSLLICFAVYGCEFKTLPDAYEGPDWIEESGNPEHPVIHPERQLGEECGSCYCPPTYTMGECAQGLECKHNPLIPDAAGTCVKPGNDETTEIPDNSAEGSGCGGDDCALKDQRVIHNAINGVDKFDPKSRFEDDSTACKTVFQKYQYADCIVYDNEDCTTDDVSEPIAVSKGNYFTIGYPSRYRNTIESVSVRRGCDLTVWSGTTYAGLYEVFNAVDGDLHLTLDVEDNSELTKSLDDSINSFYCNCPSPNLQYKYIRHLSVTTTMY